LHQDVASAPVKSVSLNTASDYIDTASDCVGLHRTAFELHRTALDYISTDFQGTAGIRVAVYVMVWVSVSVKPSVQYSADVLLM
jgi:hypothetical protein